MSGGIDPACSCGPASPPGGVGSMSGMSTLPSGGGSAPLLVEEGPPATAPTRAPDHVAEFARRVQKMGTEFDRTGQVPGRPPVGPPSILEATRAARTPAPAGIKLVGARPGDAELLASIRGELAKSPTGSRVLERLDAAGARVAFLDAAQLQALPGSPSASYDSQTNTISISRDATRQDAGRGAVQLAHEGTHSLHDALVDADKARAVREVEGAQDIDAFVRQRTTEFTLATEVEAYMVEARVAREVGFRAQAAHPALRKDGSFASFEETWQALSTTQGYNPHQVQPRRYWHAQVLDPAGP